MLQIFVDTLDQKLVWTPKRNFTCSFGALRLKADYILVEIEPKIKRGFKNWNDNIFKVKKKKKKNEKNDIYSTIKWTYNDEKIIIFSRVKVGGGQKNENPNSTKFGVHNQWALRRLKIEKLTAQNWGRGQKMKI